MPFQLYKIPDAPKFIRFLHKEKQIIITKRLSDARFSIYYSATESVDKVHVQFIHRNKPITIEIFLKF
jgi:hypothetical protein